jgi:hypothetical protein
MTETTRNLRARAQSALYGATMPTAKPSPPAAPGSKFDQHAATANALYGSKYNHALDSFHTRFESDHRGDQETLTKSREARRQHQRFFERLDMDPKDAMAGLGRLLEYEARPRSDDDRQKIAEKTFESLRMELGSTEEAQAAVEAHNRFMAAYAADVPFFAERARIHGANVDADIVRLGAHYGTKLK